MHYTLKGSGACTKCKRANLDTVLGDDFKGIQPVVARHFVPVPDAFGFCEGSLRLPARTVVRTSDQGSV